MEVALKSAPLSFFFSLSLLSSRGHSFFCLHSSQLSVAVNVICSDLFSHVHNCSRLFLSFELKMELDDYSGEEFESENADFVEEDGQVYHTVTKHINNKGSVWHYFYRRSDGLEGKCKGCGDLIIANRMSTTGMKSHLKSKHKKDIDKYNEPKGNLTCMSYSRLSVVMSFCN